MKISGHEKIRIYNERLQSLYGDVIRWLKEADIPFTHLVEDHALAEEHIGHYVAKKIDHKSRWRNFSKVYPCRFINNWRGGPC